MPALNIILSIIISVLIVGTCYILTMLIYFKIRKHDERRKFSTEIAIAGFAYLVSVVARFVILLIENDVLNKGMWDSVEVFWRALHSAIGGFAFEGLDTLEKTAIVGRLFYVGTNLYTGLVALTVITATVSHGIYSQIILNATKIKLGLLTALRKVIKKVNNQIDIYVFTSITEDSVLLCESICNEYKQGGKLFGRRKLIIFSGNSLEVFDKKNPLHAKVVAEGYLYIPLKTDMSNTSVLEYFKFFIKNDYCVLKDKLAIEKLKYLKSKGLDDEDLTNKNLSDKEIEEIKKELDRINNEHSKILEREKGKNRDDSRVHFFALELSDNKNGLETVNSARIFEEITAIVDCLVATDKGELVFPTTLVDFYSLTDSDVNYEYYESQLVSIINNKLDSLGFENHALKSNYFKVIKKYFSLHILNEAVMASECMIKDRNEYFAKMSKLTNANLFLEATTKPIHRALVLGFGGNGQQALNTLFTNVAGLDGNQNPTKFVADVYDKFIDDCSGLFAYEHPLYICVDSKNNCNPFIDNPIKYASEKLKNMFSEKVCLARGGLDNLSPSAFEKVMEKMGFPVVCFHSSNCNSISFMNQLDSFSGVEENKEANCRNANKLGYDSIIVTLGDDERTINVANALIDDIKQELSVYDQKQNYKQIIYVNLREQRNKSRINFSEKDMEKFPNIGVVVFGSAQEMYSFESIIDEDESMLFNYTYDQVYNAKMFKPNNIEDIFKGDKTRENCDWVYGNRLDDIFGNFDYFSIRNSWLGLDLFKKKSNYSVGLYTELLKAYIEFLYSEGNVFNSEDVVKVAKLEHVRWNRFHISHGWMFADYDSKITREPRKNRMHDCLCPFEMLKDKTGDMPNIIMASAQTKTKLR